MNVLGEAISKGDVNSVERLLLQEEAQCIKGNGEALILAIDCARRADGRESVAMNKVKRMLIFAGADEDVLVASDVWGDGISVLRKESSLKQNGIAQAVEGRDQILGELGFIEKIVRSILHKACSMPSVLSQIVGDYLLPGGDDKLVNKFVQRQIKDLSDEAQWACRRALKAVLFENQPKEVIAQRVAYLKELGIGADVLPRRSICSHCVLQ